MNIVKQLIVFFTLSLACGLVVLFGMAYFEPIQVAARADMAALEVAQAQQVAILQEQATAQRMSLAMEREQALAPLYAVLAGFWALVPAALAGVVVAGLAGALVASLDAYRARRVVLVSPDERGLLPVTRRALEGDAGAALALLGAYQSAQLMRAGNAARLAERGNSGALDAPQVTIEGQSALPVAPSFASLWADGFRPTMDRLLLGYGSQGAIYGSVDDLLSVLLIGRPGTGKSTYLRLVVAQLAHIGAQIGLMDPHGSIGDDCPIPTSWRAESGKEFDQVAAQLVEELEQRLEQRRAGKRDFVPALILADEFNILSEQSPDSAAALKRIICEGRKVGMYCLIAGQAAPAKSFGDSTARDAMSSRVIFNCESRQAGMAGLPLGAAKSLLPILASAGRGHAILHRSTHDAEIISCPNVKPSDLLFCAPMVSTTSKQAGNHAGNHAEIIIDSTARETMPETKTEVVDARAQQVRAMIKEGSSHAEIIKALWGAESGRKYQDAKKELEAIIAALV